MHPKRAVDPDPDQKDNKISLDLRRQTFVMDFRHGGLLGAT